jgi:hypothetical protein
VHTLNGLHVPLAAISDGMLRVGSILNSYDELVVVVAVSDNMASIAVKVSPMLMYTSI